MTDDTTPEKTIPVVLPVLPLRNIVVFPGMIVPLFVGREKSIQALEDVMADEELLLVSQKDGDQDDPSPQTCMRSARLALCCKCSNCRTAR